jgi:hypothetical protein
MASATQELSCPFPDLIAVIGMMAKHRLGEIGCFVGIIGKRMVQRRRVDAEVGRMLRCVIEPDVRLETEFLMGAIEVDHRNAVSKDIMYPADFSWQGGNRQGMVQEPLIETIARPEHQPVLAKRHRAPIAVDGRVLD